jgi:flavin-dependent dehydrogenase
MTLVIAGGGPAGALAAALLARAGRHPVLLERDAGPQDKVCGEFVSHEAQRIMGKIGVDVLNLGASVIGSIRLVHGDTVIETRLPFQGAGLSRRVMDEALLQRAHALGAEIHRGRRIRSVALDDEPVLDVGEPLTASTLFLATGKHDLRGSPRTPKRPPEPLIGFKLHLRLMPAQTAALRGVVEVILFDDGYAGLQLIENGTANLCMLVDRSRFDAAGQDWMALLDDLSRNCPHLARRLDGAQMPQDRPSTIFRVPYGHVHVPARSDHQAVFRLGDQAAVIPSFCGDGMSIALHSAGAATAAFLRHGNAASLYHRTLRNDVGGSVRLAFGLYRAAQHPASRALLLGACTRWPAVMRAVATRTRVPDAALRRAA